MNPTSENPTCDIGPVEFGRGRLAVIAGPCMAESRQLCLETAAALAEVAERLDLGAVFKASFDKANRSSAASQRGPGMEAGLEWLVEVRRATGLPVLSDIHTPDQAAPAGEVLDAIQIPAFLCRQTDLLTAAGRTGRPVNIKKGQFLAPAKMAFAAEKVRAARHGGREPGILLTERGTTFGYESLVSDFRSIPIMRPIAPVVFDATHSVQSPGGGSITGGQREFVPVLARAAMAAGADALFVETHPHPDRAASDAACQWPLDHLESLLRACLAVYNSQRDNPI
jgi:2-dehydro-3-deoxyphosphooctonate aldolase (KDO 8-P synthase)